MIGAIIFDLDNCLAAATEVGEELYEPAFAAIRQANRGDVPDDVLKRAFADVWRHPLDWVAATYGFSGPMLAAGWRVFETMEVIRPMHGYGDLAVLARLPVQRFLVTSGFRRLQESKIRALKLAPLFVGISVDAIDQPERLGKQRLFEKVLEDHALTPEQVLIVGDSAESEIAAGNRLGIRTVQTLRPRVPKASNATYHIESLAELEELLASL
jgi:FMN phosphatase YigB (HAD superfamily)